MMLDKTKHVAYIPELPGPLVDKIGNFISFVLVCLHELLTVEMVGREEPRAGGTSRPTCTSVIGEIRTRNPSIISLYSS